MVVTKCIIETTKEKKTGANAKRLRFLHQTTWKKEERPSMAKPQKSTAQSEVPGLVKKGPLYYLKRDWQLYALMLLPMVFIIVFKYFAYTGLSVAFLDYKIGKGYAGSKFVGLKIFEKVFKHRDFTKAVVNTLLLNVLDLIFSFPMPIILALLLNEMVPRRQNSGCHQ